MADLSQLPDEEIVKIESRLFKTYSQLAAIIDSSDDAIIGMTIENKITSWNHGATNIYGYSFYEMVNKNIDILCPEEKKNEVKDLSQKVLNREMVRNYETEHIKKDGSRIIVTLTLSPVRGEAENIVGISMIARDITEQRLAAEKLSKYDEIDRLNKLMIDREIKMIELKKEIGELKEKLRQYEPES